MIMHVQLLVGSQVSDRALLETGVALQTDEIGRCPALNGCVVKRTPQGDDWSYVTCYARTLLSGTGSDFIVPTVIYGRLIDDVQNTIEPVLTKLGLWNPGQFGVWTFGGNE